MKTLTIIIICATLAGCAIVRVEHNVTVDVRECDVTSTVYHLP